MGKGDVERRLGGIGKSEKVDSTLEVVLDEAFNHLRPKDDAYSVYSVQDADSQPAHAVDTAAEEGDQDVVAAAHQSPGKSDEDDVAEKDVASGFQKAIRQSTEVRRAFLGGAPAFGIANPGNVPGRPEERAGVHGKADGGTEHGGNNSA